MSSHLSSTSAVDYLRRKIFKINKPYALGLAEWDQWYIDLKKTNPTGYFFTETLPRAINKPITRIYDSWYGMTSYFNNRFVVKTHYLKTHLKPGQWYEFDTRLLHGIFGELVDFVEIEKAWMLVLWDEEKRKRYSTPWYRSARLFRHWRSPAAGLEYLDWEMTLVHDEFLEADDPRRGTPTEQAIKATETKALYTWWTKDRPARGEAWEVTGLREFWDRMDETYGRSFLFSKSMTDAENAEYTRLHTAVDELEAKWDDEDTEMAIRLIKLRKMLWT